MRPGRFQTASIAMTLLLLSAACRTAGAVPSSTSPAGPPAEELTPPPALVTPSALQVDLSAYPFIYLRDDRPLEPGEDPFTLIAVGDVMLGRGVQAEPRPFAAVSAWLGSSDLTTGNLEFAIDPAEDLSITPTPLSTQDPSGPILLTAPAVSAQTLQEAGFDLLSLANNHSLDRGLKGLEVTAGILDQYGLASFGAGPDLAAAYTPRMLDVGGARLAFLAFNAIPSPRAAEWTGEVRQTDAVDGWSLAGWDRDLALEAIRSAAQSADAVVVSIHWGYEYERRADPLQRDMARDMVEAGAGLILGHHPHVAQPGEAMDDAWVAYSLGNFVFDQGQEGADQGFALRVFLDRQGLRAVQALAVKTGLRPSLLPAEETRRLLGLDLGAAETSTRAAAFRCTADACTLVETPEQDLAAYDQDRQPVDLNGDGRVEAVTLEGGRLSLRQDGLADWTSPPEWQVQSWASGDPNFDGRQELLLHVHKPDRAGVVLSHPFLVGHRQGEYRLLWGGSAASDPILDLRLADLDLDGRQELVVREELASGSGRALSFWRWNGWGFTQIWRSEPGDYRSLSIFVRPHETMPVLIADF